MSAESSNAPLTSGKSPKAGCAIMIIIAGIVLTVVGTIVVSPFLQMKKMKEFTTTEKSELVTSSALPEAPPALVKKLTEQKKLFTNTPEIIEFTYTTDDLNNAIRSYDLFKDLRGQWSVNKIMPEGLVLDVCHPINYNPLSSDKSQRFLVSKMLAKVGQKNDELILMVSDAKSDHGEIPEGFLQYFQEYRLMQAFTDHPEIGRVMFAAKEIKHGDDLLTIVVDPKKFADPAAVTPVKDNTSERVKRRFMMPLMSFLMVIVLFIFMVKRRNSREAKKWQEQADRE